MHAGSAALTPANIRDGTTVFGTTGTLIGAIPCLADGDADCVVTGFSKAIDVSAIGPYDIRLGKNAGGIAGSLVFAKNMALTSSFDRTAGTGAVTGLDKFDTIDDLNNGGALPTQAPTPWPRRCLCPTLR